MWGWNARDQYTIPSFAAAELQRRGIMDVEVVNFGQGSYTLSQELITLLLELRRGAVPAAVVFLDGNNEVATAFQSGQPGKIFGQATYEVRFAESPRGLVVDAMSLGRYSQLISRLARAMGVQTVIRPARPDANAVCPEVVSYYRNLVAVGEALGRTNHFPVVFLWQPLLANTSKPLTPWERAASADPAYIAMLRRCTGVADSLLDDRRGVTYFPLHDLFDQDSATVFIDQYGHITEDANRKVADFIVDRIQPWLASSNPEP